ncbi:MAG: DUF433 domain-containing protein [Caldilineaceae bacterium]
MQTLTIDLISSDASVRNGVPCLMGTGIRVADVTIAHIFHQRSADEIASDYDLSLAQVYAALSYYYENKSMLDESIRQQIIEARRLKDARVGGKDSLLS